MKVLEFIKVILYIVFYNAHILKENLYDDPCVMMMLHVVLYRTGIKILVSF